MAMTASLYQLPQGRAQEYPDDIGPEGIEFTIEDGETMDTEEVCKTSFEDNLAETMDKGDLSSLSVDLLDLVDQDIASRKEWVDMLVKGMEVLGMKYDERTEPWAGACGVYSTILTEAAIRFQAEMITETFPAAGPVKTAIIGAIDKLKEEAASRVQDDMNYQLTEVMTEFRPEHERLLYSLGLAGAAFKKVYYDPSKKRQVSLFAPAENVIIPVGASSAMDAERVTHVMRKTKNEVKRMQVSGFYRDIDLGDPVLFHTDIETKKAEDAGFTLNDDDRYQFYEVHANLELPGGDKEDPAKNDDDRIALPYVVTIEKGTTHVLAVRRNWDPEDPTFAKRQHFVQYTYIPGDFGPYGLGLIHLIGGYARAGTSLIRQLVDAGTLSNLPGGMKTRGLRAKGDDTPISPGEFRDVDVPSGTLRDNIMPLPYKEPSNVLLALLNQITDEGRRLGSIADMKISDMSANAPVGTTLALLERQLKTMSAVQARVHASMKQEFKLLKVIIRDYCPKDYSYDPVEGDRKAKQADYDMVAVIPVSDPNSSTMAQRIMQYQAAIQLATGAPQIYNLPQLHRQMLEVLGIKNAEKLVPTEDDQAPRDPVSENMAFLTGKPTKAFLTQDHDAHIAVHSTMMQDPLIAAQMGQNPMAQQMQAAMMAHIGEHLAFQYRAQVQEQLGATLPEPNAQLDPQVEVQLSKLVAMASTQLLQMHKGEAAQQQAQQQMQDPLIQMQMEEVKIKGQEAATKAKKVDGDLAHKQQELQQKAQQAAQPAPQETPEMIAQRHMQEMQGVAQQQQATAQRHAQEMAQSQQRHGLQQQQGAEAADARLEQAQQAADARLAQAAEAAAARLKQAAAAKPKGDK